MTNLSPQKRYDEALATGNFSHDDVQAKAVAYLDKLHHEIIANQNTNQGFFASLFKSKPTAPKGLPQDIPTDLMYLLPFTSKR